MFPVSLEKVMDNLIRRHFIKVMSIILCFMMLSQGVVWADPPGSTPTLQVRTLFTKPDKEDSLMIMVSGYLGYFLVGVENDERNLNVTRIRNLVNDTISRIRSNANIPETIRERIGDVSFRDATSSIVIDLGNFKMRYFNPNIPGTGSADLSDPGSEYNVIETRRGKYLTRQILLRKSLPAPESREEVTENDMEKRDKFVRMVEKVKAGAEVTMEDCFDGEITATASGKRGYVNVAGGRRIYSRFQGNVNISVALKGITPVVFIRQGDELHKYAVTAEPSAKDGISFVFFESEDDLAKSRLFRAVRNIMSKREKGEKVTGEDIPVEIFEMSINDDKGHIFLGSYKYKQVIVNSGFGSGTVQIKIKLAFTGRPYIAVKRGDTVRCVEIVYKDKTSITFPPFDPSFGSQPVQIPKMVKKKKYKPGRQKEKVLPESMKEVQERIITVLDKWKTEKKVSEDDLYDKPFVLWSNMDRNVTLGYHDGKRISVKVPKSGRPATLTMKLTKENIPYIEAEQEGEVVKFSFEARQSSSYSLRELDAALIMLDRVIKKLKKGETIQPEDIYEDEFTRTGNGEKGFVFLGSFEGRHIRIASGMGPAEISLKMALTKDGVPYFTLRSGQDEERFRIVYSEQAAKQMTFPVLSAEFVPGLRAKGDVTGEQILKKLESPECGWNINKALSDLGLIVPGDYYRFFEEFGIGKNVKAKLIDVFEGNNFNVNKATKFFGLSRNAVQRLMKKYGIKKKIHDKENLLEILRRNGWNIGESRDELGIKYGEDYYKFFKRHEVLTELKRAITDIHEEEHWMIIRTEKRMGLSKGILKELMKKLGIYELPISADDIVSVMEEDDVDWNFKKMKQRLNLGNVRDYYKFFKKYKIDNLLKEKLIERLRESGWSLTMTGRQFGSDKYVIERMASAFGLERPVIDSDKVLERLESNGWDLGFLRDDHNVGTVGTYYDFFELHGLLSELKAKLIERLEGSNWNHNKTADDFNVSSAVIVALVNKLGINKVKKNTEELLSILKKNGWKLLRSREELGMRYGESYFKFFKDNGLLPELEKRLLRALREADWKIAPVADFFGTSNTVIASLIKRMGLRGIDTEEKDRLSHEIEEEISLMIGREHITGLAARYGMDLKNIVWGIIGVRLEGRYDRGMVEKVVDERVLDLMEEGDDGIRSTSPEERSSTGGEGQARDEVEAPRTFTPAVLEHEDVSEIAGRIGERLDRLESDNLIEKGVADLLRIQTRSFLKKLEEQYFYRKYYVASPHEYVGDKALEAVGKILEAENNELMIDVLKEIIEDVKAAMDMQRTLHRKGINPKTFLNLYQLMGVVRMLRNKGSILADEMGLGKTLQVLSAFLVSDKDEMLVIAPKLGLTRWLDDISRHTAHQDLEIVILGDVHPPEEFSGRVTVIRDRDSRNNYMLSREIRGPPEPGKKRIVFINHELLPFVETYRLQNDMEHPKYGFVAVDEAHLLKNLSAKTSRVVFGDSRGNGGIESEYKVVMTGTPLENKTRDLFAYLRYISHGRESDVDRMFSNINLQRFGRMFRSSSISRLSQLHAYLADRMIRRLKEDVVTGLPEKKFLTVRCNPFTGTMSYGGITCNLSGDYSKQAEMYDLAMRDPDEFETSYVAAADEKDDEDDETREMRTTQLMRMEQASLSPGIFGLDDASVKYDALRELVGERVKDGKSVVIYTDYRTASDGVYECLKKDHDGDIAYIHGEVIGQDRDREVARFQNNEVKILIATTSTAGLSIELTQADSIIWLNNPWKPSTFDQAVDRAHRISDKNYTGKELEVVSLEWDVPVSIDRLKTSVLRRKSILSEMIVNGNLSPEILAAFTESDARLIDAIEEATADPLDLDEYEITMLQKFRLMIGQIFSIKDPEKVKGLWNEVSLLYMDILMHKGSFFANMASLDYLSRYPELRGDVPKRVLDLASGPSTLYRAYMKRCHEFMSRDFNLDITDMDLSPGMLQKGVAREDRQIIGTFGSLAKVDDASYDIVNLSYAYRYAERPAELVRNIHRILDDKGLFVMILPPTTPLPDGFSSDEFSDGFDVLVGDGATLTSRLAPADYERLVDEYGQVFADDIAGQAQGTFTYLVARKKPDSALPDTLSNEDFRIKPAEKIKGVDGDKVRKLRAGRGSVRILPDETAVEGETAYAGVSGPASRRELVRQIGRNRYYRRLSRRISQAIQLITRFEALVEETKTKRKRELLRKDIDKVLDMIINSVESYVSHGDPDMPLLRRRFLLFKNNTYIKRWIRKAGGEKIKTIEEIISSDIGERFEDEETVQGYWTPSRITDNARYNVIPRLMQSFIDASEGLFAGKTGDKAVLMIDSELEETEIKDAEDAIKALIDLLARIKGNNRELQVFLENLEIVKGKGEQLLKKKGKAKDGNIIVITTKANVGMFDKAFNKKAVIAGIDTQDGGYLPILEVALFTMGKYLGWNEDNMRMCYTWIPNALSLEDPENMDILAKRKRTFVIKIIPDAEPIPVDELVDTIRRIRDILSNA